MGELRYKRPELARNRLEQIEYTQCPGSQTAWSAQGYLVRQEPRASSAIVLPWEDIILAAVWAAQRSPEAMSDLRALLDGDGLTTVQRRADARNKEKS